MTNIIKEFGRLYDLSCCHLTVFSTVLNYTVHPLHVAHGGLSIVGLLDGATLAIG